MLRVPVGKAMQECAHKNGTGPIDCGNVSVWPGGCCELGVSSGIVPQSTTANPKAAS